MKLLYLILFASFTIISCHKKAVPEKTHDADSNAPSETTVSAAEEKPTVMVDGNGKVVNSSVKTSSGTKVYSVAKARSFTPNQRQNLIYRYKTVPPKVLHVPDSQAKKNARGTYYVYKSKFWYWKKSDGYFHLDENYYN